MLRYSNNSILNIRDKNGFFRWAEGLIITNVVEFNDVLTTLLEGLRSRASKGGSFRKFATGMTTVPPFDAIYALMQCTPDLSQLQCGSCLSQAFEWIPICCQGRRGGRIFGPSCIVRFSDTLFYNANSTIDDEREPSGLPPRASPSLSPAGSSRTKIAIIVLVLSSAAGILILISICIYIISRRKKSKKNPEVGEDEMENIESLQYNFDTIKAATNNFSDENKLGQGGFGAVYKGRLDNGQEIAVKRLSMASNQGDQEFKNEVQLVARLQHRNLARLQGFCLEGKEKLLIYEFVSNSSLDRFLFDSTKRKELDWETRYKIIGGIARGLLYLHEDSRLRIIHRDLKASNILLDTNMSPKISDFGMARLFLIDQTQDDTSKIVGTYGYMAPEYVIHGQLSIKTDVYSFGILVMEIVTGQKISSLQYTEEGDAVNLLSNVWRNWREGTPLNILDPNLRENSNEVEMVRCIAIGLLCVQENVARRPTMGSIVVMLTTHSVTPPSPSNPPFAMDSTTQSDWSSSQGNFNLEAYRLQMPRNEPASINEVSITELDPR